MAAALGGLDVLVFTGGVGEHSPQVRRRAAHGLRFLGVEIDDVPNDTADGDREIGDPTTPVIPEGAGPVNPQFRGADLYLVVLRLLVGAPG